jgi:CBS domain-containing protein
VELPLRSPEQLMPFATAGELLAKKRQPLVAVTPGTTVLAALREMKEKHVAFLPVLDGEKLVGVLAERDIACGIILNQRSAKDTPVRDLMTKRVHTVTPEAKVPECVMLMHAEGIRHLPVVSGGKVQGVLSVRDLMGALIERHERLLRRLQEERLTLLYPDPSSY